MHDHNDTLNLVVLMTCHNRRAKTLACLEALFRNPLPQVARLSVVLVDDGSSDGTAQAVRDGFPDVEVVRGDGNLFWNGGMRLAWDVAQRQAHDYLLWLNDDTILDDDALMRLLATESELSSRVGYPVIVVGSTRIPGSDIPSYGGTVRRNWIRPMNFVLITPGKNPIECDTLNGNIVLVPRDISLALGNLDSRFVHAAGDTDYGLRAKAAGYSIWVMPGYGGSCVNDNQVSGSFNDVTLPLVDRMRKMLSPKGLPPHGWLILSRRHAGILWPLYWAWPYFKVIMTSLRHSIGISVKRSNDGV